MKLSRRLLEVIESSQSAAEWCADVAERLARDDQSLPQHINLGGYDPDYWRGLVHGHQCAIESILMVHNCYNGFCQAQTEHGGSYNHYYLNKAR